MGNAIKWLRGQIHGVRPETSLAEAKEELCEAIDTYVTERITFAAEMVARFANEKVRKEVGRGNGEQGTSLKKRVSPLNIYTLYRLQMVMLY